MSITLPFFGRKTSTAALPRGIEPALCPSATRGEALRPDARRFRIFIRREPTLFQRCLAAHMYFAARKSALD